jgi:hypothetical protein
VWERPTAYSKMSVESAKQNARAGDSVHAYLDPEWDGAWVTCPYCKHENAVTWAGEKSCTLCGNIFSVEIGPLVMTKID